MAISTEMRSLYGKKAEQINESLSAIEDQDDHDLDHLYEILTSEILPLYYSNKRKWRDVVQAGMQEVQANFESNRMAKEYYELIYR
jgi:starch phosphorylase